MTVILFSTIAIYHEFLASSSLSHDSQLHSPKRPHFILSDPPLGNSRVQ